MSENINAPQTAAADDEIDLRELFSAIWQGKWIIIATTFLFAVAAVFYAIRLPNIYQSEALLAPVTEDSSMRMPGQLGGLAALAGFRPGMGNEKTNLALEVLKSRDFIGRFIDKYDLYLPVMAAKGWNPTDNSLKINPKVYDVETEQWVRKVKPPFKPKPSVQETYTRFIKTMSVSQDKSNGMVKISVQHYSPFLAKQWVDSLVTEINEDIRQRDLNQAQRSITYLNEQIAQTNIADARAMLFSLIEEQTKTLMLANVRSEYVLKVVDPAVVAEKKAKPARALMVALSIIIGGMFSVIFVIGRHFNRKVSR
ncbi:Wzz/FepE/Etk N-terminal domain-containing protein [Alishewanella jeotgali]|uniref:Lipopolysaccharide biosynthesis protein n=1 Tax=Alishewanella jeotgali KCTC 22429 TaxID=1129374 RepID=H3ZAZ0_9ALTE|nr:Wzz/FepE/Etk N-terminal domain-containing protein [Alishewanella jeotgali]EHR42104.1 lipopolysaccharide biosynthesis protein [Alishewanella jeotgali KCTC 22429]